LKDTDWIGIYHDILTTDDLIESCMLGKRLKAMPHELIELKEYDYLCFLDSKLEKVSETFVEDFIHTYFIEQNYALLLRRHWYVDDVWSEYNLSMGQERYRIEAERYKKYIEGQVEAGLSEAPQQHCATGFLIRNMKHEKMIELNTTWYKHIQECGLQCQISFSFVRQLFDDCVYPFTEIPFV